MKAVDFIKKTVKEPRYNKISTDGKYVWKIVINKEGYSLKNVKVIDKLEAPDKDASYEKLNFLSAQYSEDGEKTYKKIIPNDGVYDFGDINTAITLEITTELQDKTPGKFRFVGNKAELLIGSEKFSSGNRNIERPIIGDNTENQMQKKGMQYGSHMQWTITVPKKEVEQFYKKDSLKAYDMLIFDKNIDTIAKAMNFSIKDGPTDLKAQEVAPIRMNKQKFVGFKSVKGNCTHKVYQLYHENKYVADLIEFSGDKDSEWEVKLETIPLRKEVLLRNANATDYKDDVNKSEDFVKILNTISLLKDNKRIDSIQGIGLYLGSRLDKDMLTAEGTTKFKKLQNSDNANIYLSDKTKEKERGFNHKTKSVIYRISINADGFTHLHDTLGDMSVIDTLPSGWEFKKIAKDKDYVVFNGEKAEKKGYDPRVKALGNPVDLSSLLEANDFIGGNKAEFKIKGNLNGPIVILVEAGPKEKTLLDGSNLNTIEANKERNQDIGYVNRVELKTEDSKVVKAEQEVVFNGKILDKYYETTEKPKIVKWAVEYRPYVDFKDMDVVYIKDKMKNGKYILENGNPKKGEEGFLLYELEFNEEGKIVKMVTVKDFDISYDKGENSIKFKVPNKNKAYILEYLAEMGSNPQNTVSIEGAKIKYESRVVNYNYANTYGKARFKERPKATLHDDSDPGSTTTPTTHENSTTSTTSSSKPSKSSKISTTNDTVVAITPEIDKNNLTSDVTSNNGSQNSRPKYKKNNIPDANDPNSPNEIMIIDENDIPRGNYIKQMNPDGMMEYVIMEEDVPLGGLLPRTGKDGFNIYLYIMLGISMVVFGSILYTKNTRKREK